MFTLICCDRLKLGERNVKDKKTKEKKVDFGKLEVISYSSLDIDKSKVYKDKVVKISAYASYSSDAGYDGTNTSHNDGNDY